MPDAPAIAPPRGPKPPVRWDIAAVAGFDFAALPAPAPGFGVGAALEYDKNIVALRGVGFLPESARVDGVPNVGGDIALFAGSLRYCRSFFDGIADLAPCGGLEAGALVAGSVVGVPEPNGGVGPWLSPEAALVGTLRPTKVFSLSMELEGLAQIFRPRFFITGAGDVYQPPPVTGRALAGLHLRFP